ncbi:MAG: SUMF1/EgtB/PvdO family nonheme iron enzyme [Treponema sp.]|nr:SUMF1/EgtB/PvdO family nonheme iron enzyme [Treponema sp.]
MKTYSSISRTLFSTLFCVLLALFLAGCDNPFLPEYVPGGTSSAPRHGGSLFFPVVSFETNGGSPDIGDQHIVEGGRVAKIPAVQKPGFGFAGWWTRNGLVNDVDTGIWGREWNFASDTVYGDMTLYARWGNPSFNVFFNGPDPANPSDYNPLRGVPKPPDLVIMAGSRVTEPPVVRMPNEESIRRGFEGWWTTSDNTASGTWDKQWDFVNDRMPSSDLYLFARWNDLNIANVIFEAGGASPIPRTQEVAWGNRVKEPLAMSLEGHGFGGWYLDQAFTIPWDFQNDLVPNDTVFLLLYARWESSWHTVTYVANGGSPAPWTENVLFGTRLERPALMRNTGYGFMGWYQDSRFTQEWDFDYDRVSSDITLYARWETSRYWVTFETAYQLNAEGLPAGWQMAMPIPFDQDIAYGGKVTEPPPPRRPGYHFAGWYTTDDHNTSRFWEFDDDIVTDGNTDSSNFLHLYAYWVPVIEGFVWVPRGSFIMGDDKVSGSNPARRVKITEGFYMAIHQVTQKLYEDITGATPSHFNQDGTAGAVDCVSWFDAVNFANAYSTATTGLTPFYNIVGTTNVTAPNWSRNGFRLPTEAEWEYAARGGNNSPGNYLYAGSNNPEEVAWFNTTSGSRVRAVGMLMPNSLGIFDMSGNVSEWCWDWYDATYYRPANNPGNLTDPRGPDAGTERVRRGGSWNNAYTNVRSVIRNSFPPSNNTYVMGFRLVRGPNEPPRMY